MTRRRERKKRKRKRIEEEGLQCRMIINARSQISGCLFYWRELARASNDPDLFKYRINA